MDDVKTSGNEEEEEKTKMIANYEEEEGCVEEHIRDGNEKLKATGKQKTTRLGC